MGSKNLTGGIQTLPELFRTNIGSVASDSAEIISADYSTQLTRDFLCKKIRYQLQLEDFESTRGLIFGFARGDLTVAQIAEVLATQLPDPENFALWDDFGQTNGIFWETLRMIGGNVAAQDGSNAGLWNGPVSLGGGKGIPLEAGHGIQSFVFNPSADSIGQAGSTLLGGVQLVGVFMEGSN